MPILAAPLRAELFSAEQLEQFAGELASRQTIHPGKRRGRHLLPRLRDNARSLVRSHRAIAEAGRQTHTVSPAAEWLLSNFYIVDEQVREIQEDLPPGFYRELPKLSSGDLEGYPRVYGLAWAFVAHTDSRIEPETLRAFVRAYQRVQPLTIGELWALAISLRVVLVENLRRLSERIAARSLARDEADRVADLLLGTGGSPKPAPAEVIQMLEAVPFSRAFAVQLVQRLREQDPAVTPALDWLDGRLARDTMTADELVHVEHQEQIANHATVRNVITSMRLLSQADWADFFESVSLVHEELCEGTRVAEMDFPTRDRYRHAVEELARGSRSDELEVARRAVRMAAAASVHAEPRHGDPGYYLIAKGRAALERDLGFRVPVRQWLRRAWVRAATPLYLGAIVLGTLAIVAVPAALTTAAGAALRVVAPLALLGLFPASDLAVALHPPLHHAAHGPAAPAQARARAGRAGRAAHARRHPDAPDRRGGDRRGGPQAGGPRPGQLRSRAALRAPLGLGGRSGRVAARRCGAAGAGAGGDRGAQRAARSRGRRRRPILGSAPTPAVERGRGRLDGLGAQARQAARVEPPPARSDRHVVPGSGSGRGAGAVGHPLRDHARRRFASSPGGWRAGSWERSRIRSTFPASTPRRRASSTGTPSSSPG